MTLEFPHHIQGAQFTNTAENNLAQLLAAKGSDQLTTPVARQAFVDYKNAQLGFVHQAKKYTASILAYGATIGVPVAAVVGTSYWLLKDYVQDPAKVASLVWNNEPMLSIDSPITGSIAPYVTPAATLTVFGGAMAVDFAFKRTTGFAPIRSVSKWTVGMISTALLYAAYKAGEITTSSYEQEEKEKTQTRKESHQTIFKQLEFTYNDIADGFLERFRAASNSPKELIELKNAAEQLQYRFPYIRSQLAKLDLKPAEIGRIMDKLIVATKNVKEHAFDLRSSVSKADDQYNAELLAVLSDKEFTSKAISRDVKKHAQIANGNSLGVMHTFKSYASAGALGLGSALAIETVVPAVLAAGSYFAFPEVLTHVSTCAASLDLTNCGAEAAVVGLVAIPAIIQGADVAKRVHQSFVKERAVADTKKAEHTELAFNKLLSIYNGIADNLLEQSKTAMTQKAADKLKADAENILAKIPTITAQVAKLGVIADPSTVTERLESALASILQNSEAPKAQGFAFMNYFKAAQVPSAA